MGKVFKRLLVFLTVFLTCPAFAESSLIACDNPNAAGNCGFIPESDSDADCGPIPLKFEGQSPDYGTYYLTAQYEQDAYDVYYYRGTCAGDRNPYKYNGVGHYGPTDGYTILPASTSSASQLHGIYAANNMHFVNWSAYWVDKEVCEEGASSVESAYSQSESSVFPAGHYNTANGTADNDNSWNPGSFNWYDTNKNCLLLVAQCTEDDSYTVTYKNGNCHSGTETEWTDSTRTYLNETYTIPGVNNGDITAVYSEGNDKEFIGWKLVWATSGGEDVTKGYGESFTWEHGENLVLEAQCKDTYKLEYSCGVDPDTGSTISGTAPSTSTGIHIEDSNVVTAGAPTQCDNGLLEFDHWYCVKKDHDNASDAGVFGTDGKFGTGVSLTNSWPAYDGLCTAVWKQTYSLTFDCEDGITPTSTRGGLTSGTRVNTETGAISTGGSMQIPTCTVDNNTEQTGWDCNDGTVSVDDDGVLTMPSSNVTCTPITQDREYSITYHVILGDSVYSTKDGTNSSAIDWPAGNPDSYTVNTNTTLENPKDKNPDTNSNYVIMPGRWYECDEQGNHLNPLHEPITNVAQDFQNNMHDVHLCIEAGWPIRYIACYNPNTCDDTENVTDMVCDSYNKIYYRPGHEVTFPKSTSGACSNRIDLAAFDGKWYVKSGTRMFPVSTTEIQSGPLTVYAKAQRKYRVSYDCNTDNAYGPAPVDDTPYSAGVTVTTKTGCNRAGYDLKWKCDGVSGELVPGAGFSIVRNTRCVAQWKEKTYSLSYRCNNGTQNALLSDGHEYNGTETNVSLWEENNSNPPTKVGQCNVPNGQHFDYWSCDHNISVSDNKINMVKNDVVCDAHWAGNDYKVTYNCNDGAIQVGFKSNLNWLGDIGEGKDKVKFNSTQYTFKVAGDTCEEQVETNKVVTDWNCSVAGTPWTGAQTWNIANDVNCNAIWSDRYTIEYNCGEDASGTPQYDSGPYAANTLLSTITVESSNCVNEGKQLKKWRCVNKDTGTLLFEKEPNTQFNIIANTECDPIWGDIEYDLIYDCANGDKAGDKTEKHVYNDSILGLETQKDCVVPSDTQEFDYWTCEPSESLLETVLNENNRIKSFNMPAKMVTCTAHWKNIPYSVTYDCNGGTIVGSEEPTETIGDLEYQITPFAFTRVADKCEWYGHTAKKWNCNTSSPLVNSDYTTKPWNYAYNVRCEAVWDTVEYTLTYDCKNGDKTVAESGKSYPAGTDAIIAGYSECGTKNGSRITGWDCGIVGSTITMDSDKTCTAVWENDKYSVTYDCNGGTIVGSEEPTETIGDLEYQITQFAFTRVADKCEWYGHTAKKWNCNTSSPLVNSDYTTKPWNYAYNVRCEAVWDTVEYTLTYDCKNGDKTVTESGKSYPAGTDATIAGYGECGTKLGSTITGWDCGADGVKTAGSTIVMNSSKNCDALWEDIIEEIIYVGCVDGDCKGCANGICQSCVTNLRLNSYIDSEKWTYSNTKLVTFPVDDENPYAYLREEGYYFDGKWYKTKASRRYPVSNTLWDEGPLTVCTILRPYYNVTYECGWDGVVAPEDENNPYVSGNDVTVKAGSECGAGSREGYTFTGWSCKPEAQSAFDIDAGEKFAIEADTTCTAQWTKNEYKVTYDCTERSVKSGATMQYTVHYGDEHSVASVDDKCSYDGYTFNGWVCKKVNAGNVLGTYHCPDSLADDPSCKGSSITWAFDDDLKCDALWDANHYNVIYDKGECGAVDGVVYEDNYNSDTQSGGATTGRTYTVPDVATTSMVNAMKDGYTFKGWNTVSGETKGNWTGESPWTHKEDLIVYAACEANKYTVTYNKGNCVRDNGDSYADTDGATYGERYDALSGAATSIYAGTGYEFKGWSTKSTQTADDFDANGDLIDEWKGANPWELTRDLDVYAVCTPMTYNVRYRNNTCGGEQGAIFNDKVEYDSNYTLLPLPIEWTTGTNNAVEHSIYVPVGYKFIGWKSLTTLMEPDYPDGYTFEPWNRTSTLDLFAECVEEDYRVTYDCDTIGNPYDSYNSCNDNDETGCRTPEDDTIYHITDTVPVPLNEANTCKKIGYHFDKWNCVADDDNHTELPISQNTNRFEMLAADARCTAQWIEDEYHVLYNCDSGTSCDNSDTTGCRTPEDNTAYHYDADVIISDNQLNEQDACVRFGYSPTLWACNGGYKTEELIPGDSFKDIRQDTTCTMQWEPHRYNIKYEAGSCGGTYKEFANALQYGAGYEIKNITDINNLIVPVGYEFVGWTDDEDNVTEDGVNYSVGTYDSWTKDEGLTLYAVCKKKIYNVCYDFTVKGGQWDTNDRREPLYEFDVDTIDAGVPLAEHDDKGEAPYYVFDGWYDNSEGTGNAVTSLPGNSLRTNPPTSSVLVEQTDRISAQWDEDGFANCDVMLYAKWKPAGKIKFNCLTGWAETHKEPEDADVLTAEGTYCEIGNCEFSLWHCGDYTGSRLDYRPYVEDEEEDYDYIKVLVPNTTVTCTPVKDCSNLEYNIEYRVYRNGTIQNRVIYDEQEINVNELRPNTYRPGDEPVEYPEVSWSNCEFRGWYDNEDFAGEPVTHTPALAIDEEGEDVVLYGNLVCEDDTTLCNEPGHEHWLHIGDGEYDRVCLYEKRPTSQTPAVRVSRSDKNAEPYYMMLSLDSDKKIHYGSEKKMHIVHPDGNVYNVCDKSTCPELAN